MLSAVKSLPGLTALAPEKSSNDVRSTSGVVPISLPSNTADIAPAAVPSGDKSLSAVALVLIVDPSVKDTRDLTREFGADAVEIDPLNLEQVIPSNAHAAVQRILAALQGRLKSGSSVTAIPVDLNLSLRSRVAEPVLEFPGLRIDRARREVHTDFGPVVLTKGEFDMLVFLAENPGVAFSRRELIDGCRGGDHFLDSCAIDVQIFGLRKKLASVSWHIQTLRGFGYRFVSETAEQAEVIRRPR